MFGDAAPGATRARAGSGPLRRSLARDRGIIRGKGHRLSFEYHPVLIAMLAAERNGSFAVDQPCDVRCIARIET